MKNLNNTPALTISATFKKEVTKVIAANNSLTKANESLETKSLSMINVIVKESIVLKKEVVVPKTILKENLNDYKYNAISKALKAVNKDKYFHTVIDTAIHYLKSGYTISFLSTVKLSTLKKLHDVKPTKASVKACKDNKALETILSAKASLNHTNKQKEIKAKLSTNAKKLFDSLSVDDIALIKAYFVA